MFHSNNFVMLKNKIQHTAESHIAFFLYTFLDCFSFFFFLFLLFRAYGGSQARGRIGAVAASLRQSHSSVGSKPHL